MNDTSDKTELLSVALQIFKEELLAEIPSSKKYQALMVANAMAISVREADLGPLDDLSPEVRSAIAGVLQMPADDPDLISELVKRLREGAFLPGHPATKDLYETLMQDARRRVKISNPRYEKR